jgi:hypothetical protein
MAEVAGRLTCHSLTPSRNEFSSCTFAAASAQLWLILAHADDDDDFEPNSLAAEVEQGRGCD